MAYAAVLKQMASDLLIVTCTGPNRLNALTHQTRAESLEYVKNAEEENTVRTNLCSGAGGEVFCTGADIRQPEFRTLDSETGASTNYNYTKERPSKRAIRHACTHL